MDTILSPDAQMAAFDNEKLLKLLSHASGPIRARAIPTLGARAATNASLKEALFASAADTDNLSLAFYAFIKVAWIAAITILDYGDKEDYLRLRKIVKEWPQSEQTAFSSYIKDHQEFIKVLHDAPLSIE